MLAELAKGRLRSKIPALKEALEGNFSNHHAFSWPSNIVAHIDYLDESIARLLSAEIERVNFAPFFSEEVELSETIPLGSIVGPPRPRSPRSGWTWADFS